MQKQCVGVKTRIEFEWVLHLICPECCFHSQCHIMTREKKRIDLLLLEAVNGQNVFRLVLRFTLWSNFSIKTIVLYGKNSCEMAKGW